MRWHRWAFTALIALGAASLVAAGALPFAAPERLGLLDSLLWLALGVVPLYATGVFAYLKAPSHPTTRRLLVTGSLWALSMAAENLLLFLHGREGAAPWIAAGKLTAQGSILVAVVAGTAMIALFPDGRYERRFERRILRGLWALLILPPLAVVSAPRISYTEWHVLGEVANPFALGPLAPLGTVIAVLATASWLAFIAGPTLLVLRYRRASLERRLQIKWILLWGLLVGVASVADFPRLFGLGPDLLSDKVVGYMALVLIAAFPAAVLIGLFRHRLIDIDLVVRKSLVYGALWLLIALAYVGAAAALGIAAGSRLPVGLAVLLTIAAAMLFQPARRRLERLADRWIFGERMTGYELLSRFGAALEHTVDVEELLPRLADTVRRGLGLRWARVTLSLDPLPAAGGRAASGIDPEAEASHELAIPLSHQGETLGTIECGPKTEGAFSEQDWELLEDVARQAALGIRNARLTAELSARLAEIEAQATELRASRARLVHAQDAERRRIERNIHDGVQQEVVALMARARLARNQLGRDPELADATLAALQAEASRVLEGIRELAQGIHPTVLSDRGLVEAVEDRAQRMPIDVRVTVEPALRGRRFAGEIEAAAYFVVSEGLANVLKHARARRAAITLSVPNGRLLVEVADDGAGFEAVGASGSGLSNLADRVAALSGELVVDSRPGEGTRLAASLPGREADHD
ncbi:MAG TPA: histidine kinase [Actinomycetota bacterium]|nr:histidine kinase [Actinomycetota bacterium]